MATNSRRGAVSGGGTQRRGAPLYKEGMGSSVERKTPTEEREGGQPSDIHQRDTTDEEGATEEGRRELSRAESGHES
ncbi:hypothetical protein Syun_027114 [Stephania yunnanensis]|uniref:Uncharacterized protein n=1 Tax=Stephania yunnanensis TaxID=152371 RepID=A0AAP0HKR7_9MAGN